VYPLRNEFLSLTEKRSVAITNLDLLKKTVWRDLEVHLVRRKKKAPGTGTYFLSR